MRIVGFRTSGLLLAALAPFALTACVRTRPVSALRSSAIIPSSTQPSLDASELADDEEVAWVCPMHADYTANGEGKCPRCGMALVKATPFDTRDYHLDFQTIPAVPRAGEKVTLKFKVSHPGTGETVQKFELVHDRPYHLFVISQDMQFFQHVHPEPGEDGTWSLDVTLPKDGYYEVLSDFMPSGGAAQFLARPLVTAGYSGDLIGESAHLVPDVSRSQSSGDLTASVDFSPQEFVAGAYGHLTFHLTDTASRQPVKDLQTYLGAFGHMLIMGEDMVDYVHSHPSETLPDGVDAETVRGGPDVMFEGLMPKPGRYRAWTQFRYHDQVRTFVTTFEVLEVGHNLSN